MGAAAMLVYVLCRVTEGDDWQWQEPVGVFDSKPVAESMRGLLQERAKVINDSAHFQITECPMNMVWEHLLPQSDNAASQLK